jgi:hypothetical protein
LYEQLNQAIDMQKPGNLLHSTHKADARSCKYKCKYFEVR